LNCAVDHSSVYVSLQKFYTLFLTRFRIYKIASPPQTKMTSKDDISGLVSLAVVGKHPDLMVAHPTPTIFPTIGRNFEIS